MSANWYPSDAFNASFEFGPGSIRDWLVWEGGRNFGRYSRRGDFASLNLSWFPGLKHELRLKSEWRAICAGDGVRYQLQPSGQMLATGEARPDFDVNNFGLQLPIATCLGRSRTSSWPTRAADSAARTAMRWARPSCSTRPWSCAILLAKIRYRF